MVFRAYRRSNATRKLMSRKGNNKGQPQNEPAKQDQRASMQQNNPSSERANGGGNGGGNGNASASSDGRHGQMFSSDEIAERAYQIFEREGRSDGRDMDHWLQAERELRMERERGGDRIGESRGERRPEMNAQNAPRSARQHQQQASS